MRIEKICCNNQSNSILLDCNKLFITYQIKDGCENDIIAQNVQISDSNKKVLYISQRQNYESGHPIYTERLPLESFQQYWLQVCLEDKEGKEVLSDPVMMHTCLLEQEEWLGKWITVPEHFVDGCAVCFDKFFPVTKKIVKATAYVCGLGYHEVTFNQHTFDDAVLEPLQTDYEKTCLYSVYDLTEYMSRENHFEVLCGDGFYGQRVAWDGKTYYGKPCLTAQILLEYEDGERQWVATSEEFTVRETPLTMNNIYFGEIYDARLEARYLNRTNQEHAIIDYSVKGELRLCDVEPIRIADRITPTDIYARGEGVYILDMGKNFTGFFEAKLCGSKGAVITFRFAEELAEDGSMDYTSCGVRAISGIQTLTYIKKSDEEETYRTKFCFFGYRYVEITGINIVTDVTCFTGLRIHTDFERVGEFYCSNEMLNKIHEIGLNTIESNMISVPMDCPVREKCGWLGDALVIADSVMYNYNSERFWRKYVRDMASSYLVYNTFSQIAPGRRLCGTAAPAWGSANIVIPYYLYWFYGDKRILEEHYAIMTQWLNFLSDRAENYIVSYGISDWWTPGARSVDGNNSIINSTIFYYISAKYLGEISKLLGYSEEGAAQEELADHIRQALIEKYYDHNMNTYHNMTTDCFAVQYHLVPAQCESRIVKQVAEQIREKNGKHGFGHIGIRFALPVLCEYGEEELAYSMMAREEYPGYGYMVKKGATSVWERFEDWKESGYNTARGSLSHPFKCSYEIYFYRYLLGIYPLEPGFREVGIKPYIADGVDYLSGSYKTRYGKIEVSFKREEQVLTYEITIPEQVSAVVSISVPPKTTFYEKNRELTAEIAGDRFVYRITEGNYVFISKAEGA